MLEVIRLQKRFGTQTAVADVSFRVAAGESVGLLGPNGAGKSTTVSLICGLLRPDAGRVLFHGRPIHGDTDPHKRLLGLVPQELALVEELTARANLRFFGALQGLGGRTLEIAIESGLELVQLADRADCAVHTFSGGMKRRLNLAVALLHGPELIVLDEPSVGVDPQSRNALFEGLEALKGQGKALLYTTHYMEEAERLCDRLVIIDHGRVVADGTLHELNAHAPTGQRLTLELDDPSPGPWLDDLRRTPGVTAAALAAERLVVNLTDLNETGRVIASLDTWGKTVTHLASERADLQTIFLDLTGRSLRDS